jgi:DNA topoisomerase-2
MPKKAKSVTESISTDITDPSKPTYKALDQRTHVLHRPDMYIGSVKNHKTEFYGATCIDGHLTITQHDDWINPGLHRIVIEVLSNAIDNVWRSSSTPTPTTKIKVDIKRETGEIVIWNDGLTIPIELDKETGVYNPEMLFGRLLTSSNYDDDEERMTSGRNGLGSKATNIFSSTFSIHTYDPFTGLSYQQTWTNNMSEKTEPKITTSKAKSKAGFTEFTFIPDYARFGVETLSDAMMSLVYKHVVDTAMMTRVQVLYNGEKVPVKTLKDYALLYHVTDDTKADTEEKKEADVSDTESVASMANPSITKKLEQLWIQTKDSECVLQMNAFPRHGFHVTSFVNGIETREAGIHVDHWSEAIFRPLLDKINDGVKKGSTPLTLKDIKPYFRMFLNCTVANPAFTSQEKSKLVSPAVTVEVLPKHITSLMKWSVTEQIKELLKSKELQALKKTEKKRGYTRIENLDPANLAGGKQSKDCTLVLCEGLSARSFVIKGLSDGTISGKKGRDYIGCYSLRGKPLNARNANVAQISGNKEICGIIQSLNLRYDVDYTDDDNFKTLAYGRVCLLSDADDDGSHITGLVLSFFHKLFPSLLQRPEPFIMSMRTPVVRLYQKTKELQCFYSVSEFKQYTKSHTIPKTVEQRYYKGLGTSSDQEIKASFGKKMVHYIKDQTTDEMMDKVFSNKNSDKRKEWLGLYDPLQDQVVIGADPVQLLPMSDFLDKELILFSISDCKRSLPSMMDGLKTSQRKILYTAFSKNLNYAAKEMKVAQFGAMTAQVTDYHHGEMNLSEAIVKMAQRFVGANNVSLLFPSGQFGTRLSNGADAASSRYIFTKLDRLTRFVFRKEDDVLLEYQYEDQERIDPVVYVPILPMILMNGGLGIGTAFSCSVPMYNPLDLVKCVRMWLVEQTYDKESDCDLPTLIPWYNGFTGTIEQVSEHKFLSKGVLSRKGDVVTVTEIPVGMSIDAFKEHVDDLLEQKKIKSVKNYSNDVKVHFEIKENKEEEKELTVESLKLTSTILTSNMVLFDEHGKIRKYKSVSEIVNQFCRVRYQYYVKRKRHMIQQVEQELVVLRNKHRFLMEVMKGSLVIQHVDEEQIYASLKKGGYQIMNEDETYGYLLGMHIRSFSKAKLEELAKQIVSLEQDVIKIKKTSEPQLWSQDLDEFQREYEKKP